VAKFQDMFPNVLQTQTFDVGTFSREIRSPIQVPETASDLRMQSVVFGHPRYVSLHNDVTKTLSLCFNATFKYLNGREHFTYYLNKLYAKYTEAMTIDNVLATLDIAKLMYW